MWREARGGHLSFPEEQALSLLLCPRPEEKSPAEAELRGVQRLYAAQPEQHPDRRGKGKKQNGVPLPGGGEIGHNQEKDEQ